MKILEKALQTQKLRNNTGLFIEGYQTTRDKLTSNGADEDDSMIKAVVARLRQRVTSESVIATSE